MSRFAVVLTLGIVATGTLLAAGAWLGRTAIRGLRRFVRAFWPH